MWSRSIICIGIVFVVIGCSSQNKPNPKDTHTSKPVCKQESSATADWVVSWQNCGGDGAIKSDGTLWQFGKIDYCGWGQIYPLDLNTGKPLYKEKYVYHLQGRKIGDGFKNATIRNGGYRVYAIKSNGSLWGWGVGLGQKPRLLSKSHNWHNFLVHDAGNGCCGYDIGLQKDGSIWRFPENVKFEHTNPMPYLKRVGTQKWDKILIECCTVYAMAKDGSLWKNSDNANGKLHFAKAVKIDPSIVQKLKKMPHGAMRNLYENSTLEISKSKKGGKLCLQPEVVHIYSENK